MPIGGIVKPVGAAERDGNWLRESLRQYDRFVDRDATLTTFEQGKAISVEFFLLDVLDAENALAYWSAFKIASAVDGNIAGLNRPLNKSEKRLLLEVSETIAPIWVTKFIAAPVSVPRAAQIVKNFLERHPEQWGSPAFPLVEQSLVEAFSETPK